jgi:hypothetical protein
MSDQSWMQDEALRDIPLPKLEFLEQMLFQSSQYHGKELLPFFMSLAMKSRSQNIVFSEDEVNTIIPVLQKYASPEEAAKMNQLIRIFRART